MRVAIATSGRFHVLDLARELSELGHDVVFYSVVPRKRALRFGLPPASHRGLLLWMAPFLAIQRFGGSLVSNNINYLLLRALDWLIARRLEPCDVFIGMSGLCVRSAREARERYGAKVFIERGSRHILSQKEILDDIKRLSPEADSVPDYAVGLHTESMEVADVIVVPARHAKQSFIERGYPSERIFCNPYGVDLSMFSPTTAPDKKVPTAIFVGNWSYQKGCDLLTKAFTRLSGRVRLLHVGAVADAPLPKSDWFEHRDPVPQWQLRNCYAEAHCLVLASRQEGLALVQAQALACGIPLICTDRTGGEDLGELTGLTDGIFVVPHDDIDSFVSSVLRALSWAQDKFRDGDERDLLGKKRELLSWRAYAKRYNARLLMACSN